MPLSTGRSDPWQARGLIRAGEFSSSTQQQICRENIMFEGGVDRALGGLLRRGFRRWYRMLLGAAITVGALYLTTHRPGVYWTQFDVVVLAPVDSSYPNNPEGSNPPF